MRKVISNTLKRLGYKITKDRSKDMLPDAFLSDYNSIKPYTMVDIDGALAVWEAVTYVANRGIEGGFVECGVWRGGMSMLMAKRAAAVNQPNRPMFLYDTFEGMSEPSEHDRDKHGKEAAGLLANSTRTDEESSVWAYASKNAVETNFENCGIDLQDVNFVKGKVEDTIPMTLPGKISILRLDTDWYESTLHELEHLYPLLEPGGVLLIDDYGYWQGCRRAVDEYFSKSSARPYMTMLSNGSITAVKT